MKKYASILNRFPGEPGQDGLRLFAAAQGVNQIIGPQTFFDQHHPHGAGGCFVPEPIATPGGPSRGAMVGLKRDQAEKSRDFVILNVNVPPFATHAESWIKVLPVNNARWLPLIC